MAHRILLAAGGTGGHIMPSIAFGKYLMRCGETVEWLAGSRPLEGEIYSAHGIEPSRLPLEGSPLGVRDFRTVKRCFQLIGSFFESRRLLKRFKADACVLFGGYISIPVMMAAKSLGVKILMHEQNAVAGKATRLAAKLGIPIACAWETCTGIPESSRTNVGMPLRDMELIDRKTAQARLLGTALPDGERLIAILGGSLGSKGLKSVLQSVGNVLKSSGCRILCMGIKNEDRPFPEAIAHEAVWDMSTVYSAADAVMCRAGASTLAEIAALGIPAIVVPWSQSADGHQLKNAEIFSEMTGAPVLPENSSHDDFIAALAQLPQRRPPEDMGAGQEKLREALNGLIE